MIGLRVGRIAVAVVSGALGLTMIAAAAIMGATGYETTRVALIPPEPYLPYGDDVWDDELDDFVAEYGAYPPDEPYTERELQLALVLESEFLTRDFQHLHPGVQLPSVEFIAIDDEARRRCQGVPTLEDGWGGVARLSDDPARALIEYACQIQYPPYPHVRATDRQIRWSYLFNTRYIARCLEAHGVPQTSPPPVDEYIAGYYDGVWFPQYPLDGSEMRDAFGEELCPYPSFLR